MELTRDQVKYLWREEGSDELDLVLHEEGDWDVDTKYQYMTNIYFQESTGKYFSLTVSRSGSPFSDYHYSFEDSGETLVEVKLVEEVKVVKSWQEVKNS
jgi:imidazoleglycerol phosphate dehydratase HisB